MQIERIETRPDRCPEPARWQAYLVGQLSTDEQTHLGTHLDTCGACQRLLESLAGGSSLVSVAHHAGKNTVPHPDHLQAALDELKKNRSVLGVETSDESPDLLGFLDPPAHPGHLGVFGPYEVHSLLGKGGMGIVLKAFDPLLQRWVALKVPLFGAILSTTTRRRFLREARAIAALSHEHIVPIHDVKEWKNLPCIVMPAIEGESLQTRLDRGPLPVEEVIRIGVEIARGLEAAHRAGLIHRDIKPGNILLEGPDARVKITDFGLVRIQEESSASMSGVVVGTPMYCSPEQANGEKVDHRTDLFSLGSLLYAVSTGQPPFQADFALATLRKVIDGTPTPMRSLNPSIPEALVRVVEKLHAKKPNGRFSSARETAEALLQVRNAPTEAKVSQPAGMSAGNHRRTWLLCICGVSALLLLTVCVGSGWLLSGLWNDGNTPPEGSSSGRDNGSSVVSGTEGKDGTPFVVLTSTGDRRVARASLSQAIQDAESGDTISIMSNGPFVTDPIACGKKSLRIVAGKNYLPVIRASKAWPISQDALIDSEGPLVLEGLVLHAERKTEKGDNPHLIGSRNATLTIRHCRLSVRGEAYPIFSQTSPSLEIRNSDIYCSAWYALVSFIPANDTDTDVKIDGSLLAAQSVAIQLELYRPLNRAVRVSMSHNTQLGDAGFCYRWWTYPMPRTPRGPDETRCVSIRTEDNIHACSCWFMIDSMLDENLEPKAAFALLPKLVSWKEERAYRLRAEHEIRLAHRGKQIPADLPTLEDWNKFWGIENTESVEVPDIVFAAGNPESISEQLKDRLETLTPDQFRLSSDVPGIARNRTPGADMSLVGPTAYERSRKSGE